MRKIIVSLLGSTLVVASMASAAMAAEHHARHERTTTSERAWDVGRYNPNGASLMDSSLADESGFGAASTWRLSGIRPDDWRQGVNGG
jgi:Ni/Co efflux regulator RcnB